MPITTWIAILIGAAGIAAAVIDYLADSRRPRRAVIVADDDSRPGVRHWLLGVPITFGLLFLSAWMGHGAGIG